eukprot:1167220-Pleurochrysis_carterae.AAC.2
MHASTRLKAPGHTQKRHAGNRTEQRQNLLGLTTCPRAASARTKPDVLSCTSRLALRHMFRAALHMLNA